VTRCSVLMASDNIPIQTSIGTVLAERALDMVMLILISLTAFSLEYQTLMTFLTAQMNKYGNANEGGSDLKLIFLSVVAFVFIIGFVYRKPLSKVPIVVKVLDFLIGLKEGLMSVTRIQNPVLFVVYTILIWAGYYFTTYFSLSMFPFTSDLGFKAAFMLLVIGSFGIIIPVPSVVGGPFQLFVAAALAELYFKDVQISTTAATVMFYSQTLFTLIFGGFCYLLVVVTANQKISKGKSVHV
jgi:hypothetical protein